MEENKKTRKPILDESRKKALERESAEVLRQEASEAIAQRDDLLRALFDKALDPIFIIGVHDGRAIDVNSAACRLFGYSKEEFFASGLSLLLLPGEASGAFGPGEPIWRQGGFLPERRLRARDGKEVWIEGTVTPLTIGYEECALGVLRDVTSRRLLTGRLRQDRDLVRLYLEMAGVMLMAIDTRHMVSMINRKGCEILGMVEADISGKDWPGTFLPPDERERFRGILNKLISGEITKIDYFESRVISGPGDTRLIGWQSEALKDERGAVYGIICSGEDITERKQADSEFVRDTRALEMKVDERTAELKAANEALQTEIKQRMRAQEVLNYLIEETSATAGSEFLNALVRHLASALKFRYAFISELMNDGRARTLNFWADGGYSGNFEYALKGTPCEKVLEHGFFSCPDSVQEMFPGVEMLQEINARSFIGVALYDSSMAPFGLFVAINDEPSGHWEENERILKVFAVRAALELERKRKDDELKRRWEMLQSIMDNSTAVIFIKDAQGRFLMVNRGFEKVFEKLKQDALGKTDYDLFPKEVASRLRENDKLVLACGGPMEFEEEAPLPDGTVHAYIAIKFPVSGIPGAVCGIATDITERKREAEGLKKSEALMNAAQRLAKFGSWEWDLASGKMYWSDEVYRIFGVEPCTEMTFERFMGSVHQDDRQMVRRIVEEALPRDGSPVEFDYRILLPDGRERIIHDWAVVNSATEGKPERVMVIGTAQDITERKRTEEELLRADKLESIGVLAAGIAHDFNNLLLGILGNVTIAKNYLKPDDKVSGLLSEVEKASIRAKNLTRQLLTFSKGGLPMREHTSIEQLVKDTAALVLRGSEVRCEYCFPEGLWPVEIDQGQISQVINNVVLNARQAMKDEGRLLVTADNVTVTEGAATPLSPGRYVKLTFKDSGMGIPKKIIQKVFDPFFTTKRKASGLGLSVSYSIVKKHNGHMGVESNEGEGAQFFVYLPAPERVKEVKIDDGLVKGKGRILVMDDEEMVRDVSGEMLKILGYDVEFAKEGKEAVELYKAAMGEGRRFDAVILDLTVPGGMGGKETLQRLLEIDPGIKAIVSSGYSQDPIMSDFRKFGFCGVIAKPYMVSEFSSIVSRILAGC